jgi:4-hydroxybenzoate polyprenyltransferase
MLRNLIVSFRPRQWIKNILLFAGLLFSRNVLDADYFLKSLGAFALFCALSSSVYLINDLKDRKEDRYHPAKKDRPIASGGLPALLAAAVAIVLAVSSLLVSAVLEPNFGLAASGYFLLMLLYTLVLKRLVLLDVIAIALGFVIRAVAGALVIRVSISPWLLICTTFLALFLGLNKRRYEIMFLGEEAANHRAILSEYSSTFLDHLVSVATACTLLSYALYTTAAETIEKVGNGYMIFTLPFVIYGVFRYLWLVHQKSQGGSPERILVQDPGLVADILGFLAASFLVIYVI